MNKNYIRFSLLILTISVLVFTGCQPASKVLPSQEPTLDQPLPTPAIIENSLPVIISPAADLTVVCGRVVHPDGSSLNNLNIRLAEVYYGSPGSEGAFVLDTASSPSAMTTEDGYFCTAEIAVREYVLIIGNPEENYEIYAGEDGKAVVLSPTAGEVLDMGDIVTELDSDL